MKKIVSAVQTETGLSRALGEMVRLASRSLGLSVEIWSRHGRAQERLGLAPTCASCELREGRVFDRCRKRRSYLTREEARVERELAEKCPLKMRLARLGGEPGSRDPVLFAFGYEPTDDDGELDRSVLTFLSDLQNLLGEDARQTLGPGADQRVGDEFRLLRSLSGKLTSIDDGRRTRLQLLSEWRNLLNADCGFLWLRDQDLCEFSFAATDHEVVDAESHSRWRALARRLAEALENSDQEVSFERLDEQHPIARSLGGALGCVTLPLADDGTTYGVLCGLHRGSQEFSALEVKLFKSLGIQLTLCIANAQLHDDLNTFVTDTVKTLVAAIDAKDAHTAGHSQRVNIVSMLLGHEMDLEHQDLEALHWSALLHDVGKIGMPEAILNKPCSLDENEHEIVKEHAERGWALLNHIDSLRRAAEGVRYHHEHWDGTGYPAGLLATDIPITARIIAVADTFDSIISHRRYRSGQPVQRAVEIIEEGAGTQFDPEVAATLRQLHPLLERHPWVLLSGAKFSREN